MRTRKPPMTELEARQNIDAMRKGTRPDVFARLLEYALGPIGNLSNEARAIYRAELDRLQGGRP